LTGKDEKNNLRILFLDDDERIREIVCKHLNHVGYDAVAVLSGENAFDAYKAGLDSGKRFDVVVLDLFIKGGGMNGIETMRKILEIDPAAKGILSTGHLADPAIRNFAELGFAAVIEKPYGFSEFNEKIIEITSN